MPFPNAIQNLINQFSKLPGIGPKTAERFVFYLLKRPREEVAGFISALRTINEQVIRQCPTCQNFMESNYCPICSNPRRDQTVICVVAEPQNVMIIEKTGDFNGLYHILGGVLNPSEGTTPDQLKIKELIERLKKNNIKEIILALNPDIPGESTSLFLANLLKHHQIKITRLARGLPMGSELEYADEVTLSNALRGRREM